MPESPNCKPWCEGHEPSDTDCQLRRALHVSEPSKTTAFTKGIPPEVNEIRLNAWQDEDSDEPYLQLEFWRTDDGRDEPTGTFLPSIRDLERLHQRIGESIQALRKSHP